MNTYRMVADRYYGSTARDYDKKRNYKPCWGREQAAVEKFVRYGPVLDVPVGTGRYLDIYRRKGLKFQGLDASDEMIAQARKKCPGLVAQRGTALDLPFGHKQFGTVVCSRLLNWLYPVDMAKAVQEIRRVGKEVVTSIRLGEPGHHEGQGNYTHSHGDFYAAIDGLMVAGYEWVLTAPDGEFGMFHLRKPTRNDIKRQFDWHSDKHRAIQRLADSWADRYNVPRVDWMKGRIRSEQWHASRIKDLVYRMSETPNTDGTRNKMLTDEKPGRLEGPITIIRMHGREAMLDGRRRSNVWMKGDGWHQVLVIDVPEG